MCRSYERKPCAVIGCNNFPSRKPAEYTHTTAWGARVANGRRAREGLRVYCWWWCRGRRRRRRRRQQRRRRRRASTITSAGRRGSQYKTVRVTVQTSSSSLPSVVVVVVQLSCVRVRQVRGCSVRRLTRCRTKRRPCVTRIITTHWQYNILLSIGRRMWPEVLNTTISAAVHVIKFSFEFPQTRLFRGLPYKISQKYNNIIHFIDIILYNVESRKRLLTLLFTQPSCGRKTHHRGVLSSRHRHPTTGGHRRVKLSAAADFFRLLLSVRCHATVARPPAPHCRRRRRGLRPGCLRARRWE